MLNSREGLTQTGDLASRSREGTLTARTARAQKATATPKSPKGETRKRAAKAAEGKTKMGTRQIPSKQAERCQSGNGARSVNDDSGSEDQNNSVSLDGDVEDATQSVQIVWYESDYEARNEASNSVDGGKDANPSTPMLWYESDYGARQESSGSESARPRDRVRWKERPASSTRVPSTPRTNRSAREDGSRKDP